MTNSVISKRYSFIFQAYFNDFWTEMAPIITTISNVRQCHRSPANSVWTAVRCEFADYIMVAKKEI
jgi:hypothetical protein